MTDSREQSRLLKPRDWPEDSYFWTLDRKQSLKTESDPGKLYLSLPTGTVPVRKQDLRGFDRITLQPGETQKVLFALNPEDMAYFKVVAQGWTGHYPICSVMILNKGFLK